MINLNISNENVREELIEYLKQEGVKAKHICKLVNLSETTLSLFKNGQRELSVETLSKLLSAIKK